MEANDVLDVARQAIWVALKMGAPIMVIALVVGLIISLFQALTQIQEMTLAFVPKIIVIFISILMFLPFMLTALTNFTQDLATRIAGLG